ncbi:TlpA family protein disulfide reductase [Sphingobacterium paucimobilis]|uniref:Thioredoxin-like fold domain-containing protein n=1 Tax=Sphingobacterium paucimobilis HER1398 TaxID=1346330 RepID=U2HZ79_9SPHI|nr:hypothetical protein [Sphingobacterium paucimobilis]ERJ60867.1 hypothetical protein M472_19110 [Sphingobacterium paucimobilis HER1398]
MNKINLFSICSLLFFLSCNQATEINTDITTIVAGTSKITGSIITPDDSHMDSIMVTISLTHPISGENVRQEILVDQKGKFSLEFNTETETSLIGLSTSVNPYKVLYIKSRNNDSTYIDIVYNSNRDFKNIEIAPAMNKYDMMQSLVVLNKMIDHRPTDPNWVYPRLYDKGTDEFLDYAKNNVFKKSALFVDNDELLSKEFKDIIVKDYRLFLYTGHVFDYEREMKHNYRNATRDTTGKPNIQKIDRSYFRFLKDFNLNDAQWEYMMDYFGFEGIPSYLVYNRKGILINKFTGFPGNDTLKGMINEALK